MPHGETNEQKSEQNVIGALSLTLRYSSPYRKRSPFPPFTPASSLLSNEWNAWRMTPQRTTHLPICMPGRCGGQIDLVFNPMKRRAREGTMVGVLRGFLIRWQMGPFFSLQEGFCRVQIWVEEACAPSSQIWAVVPNGSLHL